MNKKLHSILIFIPTYNEVDNVEWLYSGIKELDLKLDVLFVDDNSPDGTGKLLDALANQNSNVTVLHQKGKSGIGRAHKVGIQWAYDQGYSQLITMDSDLTHNPKDIPTFIEFSKHATLVVGSRHLQENSLQGWNFYRKLLTYIGKFLTTFLLGVKEDATGAYRLYNLKDIPSELFWAVKSDSYSFFFESLFLIKKNKFKIKEIPIYLPPRTYGNSKMSLNDIYISVKTLVKLFIKSRFQRNHFKVKNIKQKETERRAIK